MAALRQIWTSLAATSQLTSYQQRRLAGHARQIGLLAILASEMGPNLGIGDAFSAQRTVTVLVVLKENYLYPKKFDLTKAILAKQH